jgi:hypothetical protein
MLNVIMLSDAVTSIILSLVMLNAIMLSDEIVSLMPKCHFAECNYVECHYA